MPYAQKYTYVPEVGDPYMYVFYPAYGWQWVVAPWVFGWGPAPFWGVWGVGRFAFIARPWFHVRAGFGHPGFHVARPVGRGHFGGHHR